MTTPASTTTVTNPDHPLRGEFIPTGVPDLHRALDNPGLPVGKVTHLSGPGSEGLLKQIVLSNPDGFVVLSVGPFMDTYPRKEDEEYAAGNRRLYEALSEWTKAASRNHGGDRRALLLLDPQNRAGKAAHYMSYVRLEAHEDGTGTVVKNMMGITDWPPDFQWDPA